MKTKLLLLSIAIAVFVPLHSRAATTAVSRDNTTLQVVNPPASSFWRSNVFGINAAIVLVTHNGPATNTVVGQGFNQVVTIITNASFKHVLSGTAGNGEWLRAGYSNSAATPINVTNTIYDSTVGSNVTTISIPALSVRWVTLMSLTNLNNGTPRWEMVQDTGKLPEFRVAGPGLTMVTNAEGTIIWASNSWNGASQVVSGAGSGSTNFGITLSSNSANYFYLGGSNVHIPWIVGGSPGWPQFFTLSVSNDSPNAWGFSVSQGTNRVHYLGGPSGTNAPGSFTNETLFISGVSDGVNVTLGWARKQPAK